MDAESVVQTEGADRGANAPGGPRPFRAWAVVKPATARRPAPPKLARPQASSRDSDPFRGAAGGAFFSRVGIARSLTSLVDAPRCALTPSRSAKTVNEVVVVCGTELHTSTPITI